LNKSEFTGSFEELRIGATLPKFPNKAMVYQVNKPSITAKQVRAQAQKLGVFGNVKDTPLDFRVKSSKGSFFVDKESGSFTYIAKDFNPQGPPIKKLLSDKQYEELATDFLTRNGLMKEGAVFQGISRGIGDADGAGPDSAGPSMVEADFVSNGLGEFGWAAAGPKIAVYFGENGRIIGADSSWREAEPFAEYPIISVNEAIKQVKDGNAMISNIDINDSGIIRTATLVYMLDPIGYKQEFIIPYYRIIGANGVGEPFTAYTRAIPEKMLSITPVSPQQAEAGSSKKPKK